MKPRHLLSIIAMSFAIVFLAGCTDEEKVFIEVERGVFNDPADEVNGFLGYFDQEESLTACGNCHVGKQADWELSDHADAWEGLQSSGHAADYCEGCHTVSELGNALTDPAGYNLVADSSYHDVQCESCHGPGFEHVQNPDAVRPLAPLGVGVDFTTGCGECHSDAHHPFVEQWQESRHGTPSALSYAGGNPSCAPCHEGRTALRVKFLENANYIERFDTELQPFTCAVCHDPHGSPNDAQLRAPIDVASQEHLCVTCHARRGTPPSSHGPHAAQGLLVLGINVGYIPEGFEYDTTRIASTHGTIANPKLCATCHVKATEILDDEGNFVVNTVGHTFEAIPCLDPVTGLPAENCTLAERDFSSCTAVGCHTGGESVARLAYQALGNRLNFLLDQLWDDVDDNHIIDATDAGLLPQVVAQGDATQIDVTDAVVTVAEGALWNAQLAFTDDQPYFGDGEAFGVHFGAHKASGGGAHNPFLLEALLLASIEEVRDFYGLAAPAPEANLKPQLTVPPTVYRR